MKMSNNSLDSSATPYHSQNSRQTSMDGTILVSQHSYANHPQMGIPVNGATLITHTGQPVLSSQPPDFDPYKNDDLYKVNTTNFLFTFFNAHNFHQQFKICTRHYRVLYYVICYVRLNRYVIVTLSYCDFFIAIGHDLVVCVHDSVPSTTGRDLFTRNAGLVRNCTVCVCDVEPTPTKHLTSFQKTHLSGSWLSVYYASVKEVSSVYQELPQPKRISHSHGNKPNVRVSNYDEYSADLDEVFI